MSLKKTVASLLSVAWIAVAVHAETVTVTNTNIDGAGSLAAAIELANADQSLTDIEFSIPGGGSVDGIFLPEINSEVNIDGKNKVSGDVILKGKAPNGPGGPAEGLVFVAGSDNSKVTNISTEGFLNAVHANNSKVTISNSTFTSPFARAILIDNSTGSLIMNNTFLGDASLSAVINSSSNVAFLGNTVKAGDVQVNSSTGSVIGATGAGQGNIFDGNGIGEAAVLINSSSTGTRVMNNTIKNQANNGVTIYGTDSTNTAFNKFLNNKKADIKVAGGSDNNIFRNTITGDAVAFEAGVKLLGTKKVKVTSNTLDGARIVLDNVETATVGGIMADGNIIKNDPAGFSGSGAVMINSSTEVNVINNEILDNASHGILIEGTSTKNTLDRNTITGNGRSGIKAVSGDKNTFNQNVLTGNKAAAGGGKNSISLVGSANNQKDAPVITSVSRNNNEISVSGTTAGLSDKVEIFVSSKSDMGSPLMTDAETYATEASAVNGTWSTMFAATAFEGPAALFLTATATDADGNTSELSVNEKLVMEDGIAGVESATAGSLYSYEVEAIAGASYQWWLSGDATVKSGNGTNKITAVFNAAGAPVVVNVSYTDPTTGAWVKKELTVTVD